MSGKLCLLSGRILLILSALATSEALHTGGDGLRSVVITCKHIRESSRQGMQN